MTDKELYEYVSVVSNDNGMSFTSSSLPGGIMFCIDRVSGTQRPTYRRLELSCYTGGTIYLCKAAEFGPGGCRSGRVDANDKVRIRELVRWVAGDPVFWSFIQGDTDHPNPKSALAQAAEMWNEQNQAQETVNS